MLCHCCVNHLVKIYDVLLVEVIEPPPKTYVIKDKFEFFKPAVQVEMDNPDKQDTVTEMYIRSKSAC